MKTGILVIGSLLWEDGLRNAWRQDRLQLENGLVVEAPIRYGRRALTRANTFTMVLDAASVGGRAVLVPCVREVVNLGDLVAEAEALWRAERKATGGEGICAEWGCVGALFRQGPPNGGLEGAWSSYFRSNANPIPPVDEAGILQVPWPTLVPSDAPADFEIILAAATRADVPRPTASQIADVWIDQDEGKEAYFFQNVLHGIRATDDRAIGAHMAQRAPQWKDSETYSAAFRKLESDV